MLSDDERPFDYPGSSQGDPPGLNDFDQLVEEGLFGSALMEARAVMQSNPEVSRIVSSQKLYSAMLGTVIALGEREATIIILATLSIFGEHMEDGSITLQVQEAIDYAMDHQEEARE